ncbi:MAG: PLP-dependent aminotransferase family protein [Rhodocyclales bacterium GT-UBC]|nr:MAG: PLP-dependent aminotransferase family protein [Rhodocyclales bacterium GT-UBC]
MLNQWSHMSLSPILAQWVEAADTAGLTRQQQLYTLLKGAILDGRLAAGYRLPSSRQLAVDYRIARNTALHAYQQLLAEGFLVADRGGTRVAGLMPVQPQPAVDCDAARHPRLSQRAGRLQLRQGEAVLPFAPGLADLNAFPWGSWARQLQRAWGEVSARQLAYAAPGGEPMLRQALADYLRGRRGVLCSPEQVFIVPGAQLALDACARLLADPDDTVWLEEPCYPAARTAMTAAGLRIVPVPVDAEGMAPAEGLWQQRPPRLLYLTPAHQYPLGAVLSLERRLEFLRRIGDGWIIEDDYDSDFNHSHPNRPLPVLQGLNPEAPVIYVGTFSKLLYPGLRVAYMVVPHWAVRTFGEAVESLYRAGQAVEQRALARFLEGGILTRHARRMAPIYQARQLCLRDSLLQAFGRVGRICGGAAGLHLSLLLPEVRDDRAIVRRAAELGVTARPLSEYYAVAEAAANGLVLGYGMADVARIPELVARLAAATGDDARLDALHKAGRQ